MRSERLIQNSDNPGDRPERDNDGPDDSQLRSWATVIPRQRSHQLVRVLDIRRRCSGYHGAGVPLSRAPVADADLNLHLVVPLGLGASHAARKPARGHVFYMVFDRVLDVISHKENVLRTVNYVILTLFVALVVRTVLAVDLGSAAVALGVGSVPLVLYFLKKWADERADRLRHYSMTSDRVFELADKERQRVDEASRHLREEERAFNRRQMERYAKMDRISRRRSHLYANAFSGIELINIQLVEILEKERIGVPNMLRANRIRETLWRELEQLTSEEAGIHQDFANDAPPTASGDQLKTPDGGD